MKIEALDPNFARREPSGNLLWFDLRKLNVEGQGWTDTAAPYDRLPARAKAIVRDPVWQLSQHSAGLCARFVCDAQTISAEWSVRFQSLAMSHMPALGVSGLDLYVDAPDGWRWIGSAQPSAFPANRAIIANLPDRRRRHFLLNLPLYNGVDSVSLGVPEGSLLAAGPAYPKHSRRPIVFYGTSIVQGGCASRPGLNYGSRIGRSLRRPIINLGFSGNGPMDLELAALMAELDPALYVLDPLPNMSAALVAERAVPFVHILRKARPKTPILLVENIVYRNTLPETKDPVHLLKNVELRRAFRRLRAERVPNLHYLKGDRLLGRDWEGTVDGVHPNDIGFERMAALIGAAARRCLP